MSKITRTLSISTVSLLALTGSVILASPAAAMTVAVTDSAGLIAAINAANLNPGADTITITIDGTITLTADLPEIEDDLTITGSGSDTATIDGAGNYRTIWITSTPASPIAVQLSGLTITRSADFLAAIYASHTALILDDVTVSESHMGMDLDQGSITITNSAATDNEGNGIHLRLGTGSVAILSGVEIAGNGGDALNASLNGDARLDVSGTTAVENGAGFSIYATDTSTVTMARTAATRSVNGGFSVEIEDFATASMTDTTATDNALEGIYAFSGDESVFSLNTTILSGNASYGLLANAKRGGTITIDTLTAKDSGYSGMALLATDPGSTITASRATVSNTFEDEPGADLSVFDGGNVTVNSSTIQNNPGGGIRISSTDGTSPASRVTISDTTVQSNGSDEIDGGGILIKNPRGMTISVSGSTVSDNMASQGGGIYAVVGDGDAMNLQIVNSTISGNTGDLVGGVLLESASGSENSLAILNSTITNNVTNFSGPSGLGATGPSPIEIRNTIITGNLDGDAFESTHYGDFDIQSGDNASSAPMIAYSLIQDPSSGTAAFIAAGTGNLSGVDPKLGPLADNGGPTFTHLPADNSPAVNAGDPAFTGLAPGLTTDQRGQKRVVKTLDMGAVELQTALAATGTDAALPLTAGALLLALGGLALLRRRRHTAR